MNVIFISIMLTKTIQTGTHAQKRVLLNQIFLFPVRIIQLFGRQTS